MKPPLREPRSIHLASGRGCRVVRVVRNAQLLLLEKGDDVCNAVNSARNVGGRICQALELLVLALLALDYVALALYKGVEEPHNGRVLLHGCQKHLLQALLALGYVAQALCNGVGQFSKHDTVLLELLGRIMLEGFIAIQYLAQRLANGGRGFVARRWWNDLAIKCRGDMSGISWSVASVVVGRQGCSSLLPLLLFAGSHSVAWALLRSI